MANTIAGANLAQIAMETLPALQDAFLPLRAFTTDFSDDIQAQGESVTTRIPTNPTAQDLSSGYSRTDTTLTAITISLDTFYGFVWGFNDAERSKSSIHLNDTFIEPAIQAISDKVFGDVWNLVNDTNYPAAAATELAVATASFDRDDVADAAAQLTVNGARKRDRSLILHPTQYGALAKDLNAADSAGQTTTIGEHRIPRLHGFDVYESSACDDNSVNAYGLACHKSNLLIAARGVDAPEEVRQAGGSVETVIIPDLGLPVQFRKWYDLSAGELIYSMGVLYGVKFGVPSAGLKFVTA